MTPLSMLPRGVPSCAMFLSGKARLAGVIGWPVAHSRSPQLHGFWLRRHGVDGAYVPLAVAPEHLAEAVRGLRAAGFRGANVAIPHKETVLALCDRLEASAVRAGAANTLVFEPAGIVGSNTDGAGFLADLSAHGVVPASGPALLIGAGGAARAIAAALLGAGVGVSVANRSMARAEALVEALPGLRIVPWEQRNDALSEQALIVNCTALGMRAEDGLPVLLHRAAAGAVVADIVYAPLRTRLLAEAEARGLRAVGGLGMLLHQAVPGFAAWFGITPVVDSELYEAMAADIPRA